jgi:hypothetical protein
MERSVEMESVKEVVIKIPIAPLIKNVSMEYVRLLKYVNWIPNARPIKNVAMENVF